MILLLLDLLQPLLLLDLLLDLHNLPDHFSYYFSSRISSYSSSCYLQRLQDDSEAVGIWLKSCEPLMILFLITSYKAQNYTDDQAELSFRRAGCWLMWKLKEMGNLGDVAHDGGDALIDPLKGADSHARRVGRGVPGHPSNSLWNNGFSLVWFCLNLAGRDHKWITQAKVGKADILFPDVGQIYPCCENW